MSRNLSASVTSISQLPSVRFRLLVDIYSLSTGTTRAITGMDFVTFNGNTYSPVGYLGGIEKVQEDSDLFPRAVRLWLAAVNTQQITDVMSENMFNCPVKIYRTFLTDQLACVSTPEELFRGFVNKTQLKLLDPDRGNYFELEVESRLLRRPRAQYFNRETLWTFYNASGDTFFDYVSKIPTAKANWGGQNGVDFNNPLPSRPTPGDRGGHLGGRR